MYSFQNYSSTMVVLFAIDLTQLLAFFMCYVRTLQFNDDELFTAMTQIHLDECPRLDPSCHVETSAVYPDEVPCCGFCDCDFECMLRGSCCPDQYGSFDMGRTSIATAR